MRWPWQPSERDKELEQVAEALIVDLTENAERLTRKAEGLIRKAQGDTDA